MADPPHKVDLPGECARKQDREPSPNRAEESLHARKSLVPGPRLGLQDPEVCEGRMALAKNWWLDQLVWKSQTLKT